MAFEIDVAIRERLVALCSQYAVRRLRVFGSAAGDDFDPEKSDLDFLVAFGPPPATLTLPRQYFGLLEDLQALFGRHVDLLEEHAIKNRFLKRSAEASAVTLYAA